MDKAIVTTSWDDGHPLDLKLAKLLRKHRIPATFYISLKNVEKEYMRPKQIRTISRDFDIGAHTVHHFDLTNVSMKIAEKEVFEGKKELENIVGRKINLFCYPCGKYNKELINVVKRAGFRGARTLNMFNVNIDHLFKIGITAIVLDLPARGYLFNISKNFLDLDRKFLLFVAKHKLLVEAWDKIALSTLDYIAKNGGIWHIFGHSWEIEKFDNWKRLEDVLLKIKETSESHRVLLLDNYEVVNYIERKRRAQRSL